MSTDEPWLGHWDGCSIAYSPICDCDPNNPIDFSEPEGEVRDE